MLTIASYVVYDAVIRPGLLAKETRYLVTDKRVLIQRRSEELHLDRARIVDVIEAPSRDGYRDVFLVLDGPKARAVATSGAFGELGRGPHLRPVFESVDDAESVSRILETAARRLIQRGRRCSQRAARSLEWRRARSSQGSSGLASERYSRQACDALSQADSATWVRSSSRPGSAR